MFPPERIVCLTEETVETLYLLGEEARIVGISGSGVRPREARRDKPWVSAFTLADISPGSLSCAPISFKIDSWAPSQRLRPPSGIGKTHRQFLGETLSAFWCSDQRTKQADHVKDLGDRALVEGMNRDTVPNQRRNDPMISGIAWISELIEIAGGTDVFADRPAGKSKERIVTATDVITCQPDIIIGSWCGKKFRAEKVAARAGFDQIPAVQKRALYEIKSPIILQPGPAALTDGLSALEAIISLHV